MKEYSSLFCYRPATTPLHRLPAGFKLLGMGLTTIAVFSVSTVILAILTVLLTLLVVVARVRLAVFLKNCRLLLWYAVLIGAFRCIGKPWESSILVPELVATALYLWQLLAVLMTGTVFYETTSTLDIRNTLSGFQKKCEHFLHLPSGRLPDIGFLLSLTITFIPRIFDTWSGLCRSWDARGGSLKKGPLGAWLRLSILLPALIERLLSIAANTDRAIRNRSSRF